MLCTYNAKKETKNLKKNNYIKEIKVIKQVTNNRVIYLSMYAYISSKKDENIRMRSGQLRR